MRFALSEEQIEFSEAVRGLLSDTCGPDAIRAAWPSAELAGGGPGGGNGRVPRAWSALADMGVLGITVPETFGGLGMTYEDLSPLLVEAGRVALPDPLSATAGVAVAALVAAAGSGALSGEAQERVTAILASIADGSRSVGVLFPAGPAGGSSDAGRTDTAGAAIARSNNLAGAGSVDELLAFVGNEVLLIDKSSVELSSLESVDGARCLSKVTWGSTGVEKLLSDDAAEAASIAAFEKAALGASAELLGLSRTMLEMAVAYATERRQFGVPIGTFQAVKHQLSNASLKVEFCEPLIMRAAHSLTIEDPEASIHVSMAKSKVSAAALEAAATSLQVHGAIGYTVECDLHLFMKRTWALAREYGDSEFHRSRVRSGLRLDPTG
ncbi:MAG TPA: acyl-CoA dehydrogenase family protein [Microthrixaceae bacterium]|nr:acyl-CoA dehydrogenase family protein [Microthrixaceae bacterium]